MTTTTNLLRPHNHLVSKPPDVIRESNGEVRPPNRRLIVPATQVLSAMRSVLLLAALTIPATAHPQAGSDWTKVQAIPAQTLIRVASPYRRPLACNFIAADDGSLTCTRTQTIFFFPVTRRILYRRADVSSIKLSRQLLSAVVGAGIGGGVGAGIGAGVQSQYSSREDGNLLVVVAGFLGAALGGGIGSSTDFLAGPTLYHAP